MLRGRTKNLALFDSQGCGSAKGRMIQEQRSPPGSSVCLSLATPQMTHWPQQPWVSPCGLGSLGHSLPPCPSKVETSEEPQVTPHVCRWPKPPPWLEMWAAFVQRWAESPGLISLALLFRSYPFCGHTHHPRVGWQPVVMAFVPELRASVGSRQGS